MPRERLPTQLKALKGTLRAVRENAHEPKHVPGVPAQPDDLSDGARQAWDEFVPVLQRMGVLSADDGAALEALCTAQAEMREAQAALRARGGRSYQTTTPTGGIMHRPYPEVAMVQAAHRIVGYWLSKFGLTPSDRGRVSSASLPADEDPWEALASGQR